MSQAKILTDKDYRRVLLLIAKKKHQARNKCLVAISHLAGLRVGEISSLTLKHVLNDDGTIKDEVYLSSVETKGSRGRSVLFPEKLREAISNYLCVRFKLKEKDLKVLNQTDTSRALFYCKRPAIPS